MAATLELHLDHAATSRPPAGGGVVRSFVATFLALAAALIASSHDLFTKIVHEEGDNAANSILVVDAKNFELLFGNYSRLGFHHPGPVFLYVQAAGEWLLHDLLGVVPSPFNGQAIAILILNALLVAICFAILFSWYPSVALQAGLGGVLLLFLALYTELISSLWMPFVYFAPFLLLLVAGTSVAAGRTKHLWALALAAGLLVHGHAEFLFFVPLLCLYFLWRWAKNTDRAGARRSFTLAGIVLAAFLLPIVLNTILHWPGEVPKYFTYGVSHGLHTPWAAAGYALGFWGPNLILGIIIAPALFAAVHRFARDEPFIQSGLRVGALALGLVFGYALVGIDSLREVYIGVFSRAIPLFMLFLAVIGLARRLRWPALAGAHVGLLVMGLVVTAQTESLANRRQDVPGIPATLAAMSDEQAGRPIVIELSPQNSWAEGVPLVLSGERAGLRLCLADRFIELIATPRLRCTPSELTAGVRYVVSRKDAGPPAGPVAGDLGRSWVTRAG